MELKYMEKIEILEIPSELTYVYKASTTARKSDKVVEKGIMMVQAHLDSLGVTPAGVPFVAYLNCSEDFSQFDIEVGFPISESVEEKDGMMVV